MAGFVQPVLVLYLTQDRRLSPESVGLIVSAVGAGAIVSQLLGGWLADRAGRRLTLLIGFIGTAIGLAALATARLTPTIWLAAFIVGVMADLFRPAASAIVADLLGPRERIRVYSLLTSAANLGFSIATALAALLAGHGFAVLFWTNATLSILVAALVWWTVPESRPEIIRTTRRAALPVMAVDWLFVVLLLLFAAYGALYFQGFSTLALAMLADGHGTSSYALLMAMNGMLIVALQPFAGSHLASRDPAKMIAGSMLLVGVGQGTGAVVHSFAGYAAGVAVWTTGEIGLATMFGAVFAALAPADLRGRYLGLAGTSSWGVGAVIGPLVGGIVLDHAGRIVLWSGSAMLGVLLCLASLTIAPHLRRRV